MHINCLCTTIGSLFSLKYLYLSHICIWTILQQNIGKIFCNSTYTFLTLSFHLHSYNILCVHLDKCNHFSSTYQILLNFISSSNHTSYSFKCLFSFIILDKLFTVILKTSYNPCSCITFYMPLKLISALALIQGLVPISQKVPSFIFSSCSSSASMLRWNSFKHPQNHLTAIHIMCTRKSTVAGSWLPEITTYHTGQQCLAVCLILMYVCQQSTHCSSASTCKT